MKNYEILSRILLLRKDHAFRRKALIGAALAGLYVLIIPAFLWNLSVKSDLAKARTRLVEFAALSGEYQSMSKHVSGIERKKSLTTPGGLAQVIGEISLSLGMKDKIKSIKGTGIRKVSRQMTEESAEIQMEKLNASELVYFFQKVDNAPMILSVTRMVVKKSFENPDLLDVTTALSLFK